MWNSIFLTYIITCILYNCLYERQNEKINNEKITTNYDHRIAMAFAVLGSKIGPLNICDSESIKTSFPTFVSEFNRIGGKIFWEKMY